MKVTCQTMKASVLKKRKLNIFNTICHLFPYQQVAKERTLTPQLAMQFEKYKIDVGLCIYPKPERKKICLVLG